MTLRTIGLVGIAALLCSAPHSASSAGTDPEHRPDQSGYVLGSGDLVTVRVMDVEEISDKPVQIDTSGYVRLPLAGRLLAAGLTIEQFEAELVKRLKKYLVRPDVSVSVATFRSQPVSIIGAVKTAGVYQVEGEKTIIEVLSLAGGLDTSAGPTLTITRELQWGRIPLKGAADDPTGRFSVATVRLKSILEADNPQENIAVKPHDVITVPRAQLVYVIGEVQKAGGFPLSEREHITVLQALSLAGGLDRTAAPAHAKILRALPGKADRSEVAVDVKMILDGKATDFPMEPDDILFIPNSASKRAALRAVEAAIQTGTGIAIFRH